MSRLLLSALVLACLGCPAGPVPAPAPKVWEVVATAADPQPVLTVRGKVQYALRAFDDKGPSWVIVPDGGEGVAQVTAYFAGAAPDLSRRPDATRASVQGKMVRRTVGGMGVIAIVLDDAREVP